MITVPTTIGEIFLQSPEDVVSYSPVQGGRTLIQVSGGVTAVATIGVAEFEALLDG